MFDSIHANLGSSTITLFKNIIYEPGNPSGLGFNPQSYHNLFYWFECHG